MDTKFKVSYTRVGYDDKVVMGFRKFEDAKSYAKRMSKDSLIRDLKLTKNDK